MAVNAQAYFSANPDVAASYAENAYGMTPQQFADFHYENYGRNEQRSPTGSVSSQQILDFLTANPNLTDAQIASAMQEFSVTPAQMAAAVGLPVAEVESRYNAALPFVNPVIEERVIDMGEGTRSEYYIKGTNIQADAPTFTETASTTGLTESSAPEFKANNTTIYDPQAKGEYVYSPEGKLIGFNAGERTEGFGGLLQDVYRDSKGVIIPALTFGALSAAGLLGGAAGGAGATAGMTAAELAQLDIALGGLGGTAGGASLVGGATIPTITSLTGGSGTGLLTTPTATAAATTVPTSTIPASTAATTLTPAATALTPAATALTPTAASVLTPAAVSALSPTASSIASSLIPTAVQSLFTPTNVSNLISGGLGTAGSLLQMQQSKEAAQAAQQRIDAETAAAKQSAAFRPIGMTTRFGTSQFAVDPVTGQLTSAGYTLSPEAQNAQDRLVKLAESGLQQAEGAQAQFAPLQTGAQNLFNLGNQYIAQSPEAVAQNYLNQQIALLQPGRELELSNLQNRLQQQGRGGLSVAQGGPYGATTPELQALFNARAQQEAQLAAQAQQAGQQQVAFGAGLLGTGAQTMGQYYGGQQAAYSPYTTALGQVQGLEQLAQQPFQMGASLGQTASTAGARVGQLGLQGAGQSVALATGADATRNLGAQGLIAAGNPNAMFGQAIGGALSGLFNAPQSGFSYGQYGTGIDPSTGEYFGSLYF